MHVLSAFLVFGVQTHLVSCMILVSILGLGSLFKVQPDLFELTFRLSMIMELFFATWFNLELGQKKLSFMGLGSLPGSALLQAQFCDPGSFFGLGLTFGSVLTN